MFEKKLEDIERLSGDGNTPELKKIFKSGFTQPEIDTALENAIAFSKIETAKYLLSLGARLSSHDYQGVYYAVHNDELEGLKFAISQGVDINLNNGILLNTSVQTATNQKKSELIKWLLDNGADINLLTKASFDLVDKYGSEELKNLLKNAT